MKKTKSRPTTIDRLRTCAWYSSAVLALSAGLAVAVADAFTAAPLPDRSERVAFSAAEKPDGEIVSAAGPLPSVPICVSMAQPEVAEAAPPPPRPGARLSDGEIRALVQRYTERYHIPELAEPMARVIHAESRGFEAVMSKGGRYVGLCQFMPRTFRANVADMKRAGVLLPEESLSPLDPEDAVNVMAWMWSRGYCNQWGPARRMDLAQLRTETPR